MSSISGNAKKRSAATPAANAAGDDDLPSKNCGKCGASNPLATRFCIACREPFAGHSHPEEKTDLFPFGNPNAPVDDAARQAELAEAKRALESLRIQAEADVKAARDESARLQAKANDLQKRLDDQVQAINAVTANVRNMEVCNSEKVRCIAELEAKIKDLGVQTTNLQSELAAANAEVELAKGRLASFQASGAGDASKDAEILRLNDALAKVTREDKRLADELSKALDEIKAAEAQAATLAQARDAAFEEINDLLGKLEAAEKLATDAKAALDAARADLAKAQADAATANANLEQFRKDAKAFTDAEVSKRDKTIADLNARLAQLDAAMQSLKGGTGSAATAELADLRAKCAAAQSELDAARQQRLADTQKLAELTVQRDNAKGELDGVKWERDRVRTQLNEALNKLSQADQAARNEWEGKYNQACDALDLKHADETKVKDDEIAKLKGQIASHPWMARHVNKLLIGFAALAVILGIAYAWRPFLGLFAKPEQIQTSAANLQKYLQQDDPACLKGVVDQPSGDTFGLVCPETPVSKNGCTDVRGCKIQLPSNYAAADEYQLTPDVMRAFRMNGDDPHCVTEAVATAFQKPGDNGLRIGFCKGQKNDSGSLRFNSVRNCWDYSELCLINPEH